MAADSSGAASALMQRKAQIDEDLKNIEKQIRDLEDAYIEETHHYGNVIKGWEGYLNAKPKPAAPSRKPKITPKDRLFSSSSVTAPETAPADDDEDVSRNLREKKTNKSYAEPDDDDEYVP